MHGSLPPSGFFVRLERRVGEEGAGAAAGTAPAILCIVVERKRVEASLLHPTFLLDFSLVTSYRFM